MCMPKDSLDFLSISLTQHKRKTECCVLWTPTTPMQRYLIPSTSAVNTTGDTSSTTTTELILRFPMTTMNTHTMNSVRLK